MAIITNLKNRLNQLIYPRTLASAVAYDNEDSDLDATEVQGAIDEVYNEIENYSTFTESEDGLVPAPVIATGKVLSDDGTWVEQSGGENIDKTIKATSYNTPWDCIVAHPDKEVLLCIGDSLTAMGIGYKFFLEETLKHSTGYDDLTINREAHSGYRIWDVYNALLIAIGNDGKYPDARVFTVLLGTNDTKTNNDPPGGAVTDNEWLSTGLAKASYVYMFNYLRTQRPDCDIRIMQIPWIREDTTDGTFLPTATWEGNREIINDIIIRIARGYGMPSPPDLYDATKDMGDLYEADGLHFSSKGYRTVSPIVASLLKQSKPDFSANRDYMTGREYTITGGVIASGAGEWSGFVTHSRKLTNGKFPTIVSGHGTDDMFKYHASNNGGLGNSIEVVFEVDFGEKAILNDITTLFGRYGDNLYVPNEVEYLVWDGTKYRHVGEYIANDEIPTPSVSKTDLFVFLPEKPFEARGLKIKFKTTFEGLKDWLLIGEIAATKLDNYDGEVTTFGEMILEE